MTTSSFETALPLLTLQPNKVRSYKDDFVPEQAWRVLWNRLGSAANNFLYSHSFLLVKPETIARRGSKAVLNFVSERGFIPIAHAAVDLSRNTSHHIWRFQWNAATTDRVHLTNLINSQSQSFLLLLRDTKPGAVPASVKLWRLKGSAHAERRTAEHLRSILNMHNRMLGFVHTPDEPADFIRELSILFEPEALNKLLLLAEKSSLYTETELISQSEAHASEFESKSLEHSVHPDEVVERLSSAGPGYLPHGIKRALAEKKKMSLAEVQGAMYPADQTGNHWDTLTLAAELIKHDRPGVGAILDARAVGEMYGRWAEEGEKIQSDLRKQHYGNE